MNALLWRGPVPAGLACTLVLALVGCQGAEGESVTSTDPIATTVADTASQGTPASTSRSDASIPITTALPPPDRCAAEAAASEILVWHAISNDSETKLEELTERFNELGTGVTVRLEKPGNYAESLERLASVPVEERPDAFLADARGLRDLIDSGLVIPPAACPGASPLADLLPVIASTYSIDGVMQSYPFNVSVPALVYDAALFRAAGLDPAQPPITLDDLEVTSQRIVEAGVAPHGFVAWDGYGPWFVTQYNSRVGELSGFPDNGRNGRPVTEVDFATTRVVESFEWLRAQVDDGTALWIGGNPSGTDDLVRLVDPVGGAAMTITTSAVVGDLSRVLATGVFDNPETGARPELAAAPMPGPGAGALVGGGAFFVLDKGDPGRAAAAAAFVSWLTDPVQHAEFAAFTGFSPIREVELDEAVLQEAWLATPALRVAFDVLVDLPADPVHAGPAWGAGNEIDRLLYETLTAVIEGADARASLEQATEQTNGLLDVYNASFAD